MTTTEAALRRDPRIDPKPGDVLEVEPGCCTFRHVSGAHASKVSFHSRCGQQWLNSTMRATLEEWRSEMANARVVSEGR